MHSFKRIAFCLGIVMTPYLVLASQDSGNQANELNRAEVDKSMNDLNDTLTTARVVPNFENGKPAGYKTVENKPRSVYDKLELKNGDVVKAVNGEEVNDPQRAFQLLNGDVKTNRQVKVVREGEEHTLPSEDAANSDGNAVQQ